ncbi:hypothetical protein [Enterobacter huaxiensis]|uniref:Uncharacterized protein n=1 Tax=Enterobacter huaxiensis TaxID=2494702 RepID=A0ABU6EVL7_9ENTR|nr:hypothetical protein [Enterobacter huaxiensis]MEB7544010.1 hypothetical protein [Enterobacter huaxiensis]MEB7581567.1 hypothetical protein [Enterobacter huaxiensis]MEB7663968.1 hypothetical protein [Enterobacter huaxiensis]
MHIYSFHRLIILSVFLHFLIGIDKQLYYEEGDMPWVPIPFIKHSISSTLFFELPVPPSDILRDSPIAKNENDELYNYCQVRYGTQLPECRETIKKKLLANGFYIPD